MTKTFRITANGQMKVTPYDNEYLFRQERVNVADLGEMSALLTGLLDQPDRFIVRGQPIEAGAVTRRLHAEPGKPAHFRADPVGHRWIILDIDKLPLPGLMTPEEGVVHAIMMLPPEFRRAECHYKFSASQDYDECTTISCHLAYWLDRPLIDNVLADWARWFNKCVAGYKVVDPQAFVSVQPIYTARPVFGNGLTDPWADNRSGFLKGECAAVALSLPPADWDAQQRRREYEERCARDAAEDPLLTQRERNRRQREREAIRDGGYRYWLTQIGDHTGRGFHESINLALWSAIAEGRNVDRIKREVRAAARAAPNHGARDLDFYLSDARLDASIAGARRRLSSPVADAEKRCPPYIANAIEKESYKCMADTFLAPADPASGGGPGKRYRGKKAAYIEALAPVLKRDRHKTAAAMRSQVLPLALDHLTYGKFALWENEPNDYVLRFQFSRLPAMAITDFADLAEREVNFFCKEPKQFKNKLSARGAFTALAEHLYETVRRRNKGRAKRGVPLARLGQQIARHKRTHRFISLADEAQLALLDWTFSGAGVYHPIVWIFDGQGARAFNLDPIHSTTPNAPRWIGYHDPDYRFLARKHQLSRTDFR